MDLVDVQLWPRLVRGSSCPTVLKRMGKIRAVCKAWREYVENTKDWMNGNGCSLRAIEATGARHTRRHPCRREDS